MFTHAIVMANNTFTKMKKLPSRLNTCACNIVDGSARLVLTLMAHIEIQTK